MFGFVDYTIKTTSKNICYKVKLHQIAKKQPFAALMVYDNEKKNKKKLFFLVTKLKSRKNAIKFNDV
jgi:hypothetical protein